MPGIADVILGVGRPQKKAGGVQRVADIIEFIESPWGLNSSGQIKLFPVQKVILKAHYGLELDKKNKFRVTDFRRQQERWFTEAEYLQYLFDDGRSNIKEVDHERRELVLSIGRRSGKCILGDSLVLTDGGIHRIEELGDPNGPEAQPLDVEVAQEGSVKSRSRYFYNGGVKNVRKFTTHCGYRLGGTDNHRIKVMAEDGTIQWRYHADLRVGDWVALHRTSDLWASGHVDTKPLHNEEGLRDLAFPDMLDVRWGRLLGYLVGDGLWNYHNRVEVTVEHPETWEHLKALFTDLFGSYSIRRDKRTENTGAIAFYSVGMRRFLHDLGFKLGTERDQKMVPWVILRSPKPVVCAFLRGLFETDGGVESSGQTVSFSTASRRLASEVQVLLLNLGIISRVKPKLVKGRIYYVLTVRGLRSRKAFAQLVGFDSQKKMAPLLESLEAGREGGDTESIPFQRPWVRKLLDSIPKAKSGEWSRTLLREVLGNTIKPGSPDEVGYPRLATVLPLARRLGGNSGILQHFEYLQETDYFYDQITSIDEERQPVYDLTVPDGESFVANGFTNHNTFMASCISAYETYKLILKGDPQMYYGLPPANQIQIISVATDRDQAGLLYKEVSGHFRGCPFFSPYTANNTQSYARFQTPKDIERYGRYTEDPTAKATIQITFRSCIAKGLRGAGNIVVILDEVAHFTDGGQSSAEEVYKAVTPSAAAFAPKDPNNKHQSIGDVESRIISISSPLGCQGQFYKLFQVGMRGGEDGKNMLCIQAPTWEVNPSTEASFLVGEFNKDPTSFFTEFGAQFTARTRGWIEHPEDLTACVDPELRPQVTGIPRRPHFIGLDIGLSNDGSAAAIGHIEDDRIVLDALEYIKAGEPPFEKDDRLDFDAVADWVYDLSRRFLIAEGMFDQWAGIPFQQALEKRGLKQVQSEHMTKQLNSDIYKNFKDMMWDKRLVLFDWPIPQGEAHCGYIQELLDLQAEQQSKYVITVEAPNLEGMHDDRSDALVRMVWLAGQRLGKTGTITRSTVGPRAGMFLGAGRSGLSGTGRIPTSIRRNAFRMGSSPDRQMSKGRPGHIRGRF